MGSTADLALKAACEGCGAASDLYCTGCRHTTLCSSCGTSMARSRARCAVCAAPITSLIQEYNVRVNTGGDKALSIGRFAASLPPFSKKNAGNKWSLRKDGLQGRQLTGNMREKYYNRKPWILEDETGEHQYQGQPEGSQSATATYYLLLLHGKEFHAVPVGSCKIAQYKQLTLEEAEEKMNKRRSSARGYERWMMKAATNGAAAFSSDVKKLDAENVGAAGGVHAKKGNMNRDGNHSDKGEEDEQEEAAGKNRHGLTRKGMDDEEGGKDADFDLDDEIEKGDDWEHEEIFTDDDEAVDIDPEETDDLADPEIPAPPETKQDDNENERGGGGLSKSGKELKKLLRRVAGQNESDNDNDEDTDDNEASSPVLALKWKDQPKSEPGDNSPAKPTPPEHAHSTPPASKNQKRKSGPNDAKTSNGAASKKPKEESETKASVVKVETPSSLEPTSNASASARSDTNVSPVTEEEITVTEEEITVTEEEIRRVLLAVAPVTTQDLVSRFKSRLRSPEDKLAFTAILRKISYMQKANGQNYIVLREGSR